MAVEVKKCIIISGAPDDDYAFLKENIDTSAYIIAADSGYQKLLKIGITPNLILGDFDSSPKPDVQCDIEVLPCEKAYSDTFECVKFAVDKGYNHISIFGAIGSRMDHTYANILCLDYCRKNGVFCEIVNGKNRLSLIEGKKEIKKEYENFSLFAYLTDCKEVRIKGAYYTAGFYNLDALDINLGDQFALSNFVNDEKCEISLKKGVLLLIESND